MAKNVLNGPLVHQIYTDAELYSFWPMVFNDISEAEFLSFKESVLAAEPPRKRRLELANESL